MNSEYYSFKKNQSIGKLNLKIQEKAQNHKISVGNENELY